VKIEALVKLGELLKEQPKATGTRGQRIRRDASGGYQSEPPEKDGVPTLTDLCLGKRTSMIAQRLAALPDDLRQAIAARL
jgi:hypothetical protein